MPSRSVDILIRVVLGMAGLASMALVFAVVESTEDWTSSSRVAATLPLAAVAAYGLAAASELRDKHPDRDLLRFRRFGKGPMRATFAGDLSTKEYTRPSAYATAIRRRFAARTTKSLIVLGVGLLGSLLAWTGANRGLQGPDFSETGFLWIVALPLALWATARSLLRVALSGSAVTVANTHIILGISLGFAWPVRIPFEDIELLAITTDDSGRDFIIGSTEERTYHVDGKHLADAEGLADWFEQNLAGADTARVNEVEFAEATPTLSEPVAVSDSRPPQGQLEQAKHVMTRRTQVTYAVLGLSIALAAFVAWSWVGLKAEQDHVEANGTLYAAEVFRVEDSSRGVPGEIHVRFNANGTTYERIIYSGWFKEFRSDLRGETVPVLFDPNEEGIAKLPGSTHHGPLLGFGIVLALGLPPLAISGVRNRRRADAALNTGTWQRIRFSSGSKKNAGLIVRRPGDQQDHMTTATSGRGGESFTDSGAWMTSNDRLLLVLPDNSERVLTTWAGKSSPLRN